MIKRIQEKNQPVYAYSDRKAEIRASEAEPIKTGVKKWVIVLEKLPPHKSFAQNVYLSSIIRQ